MQSSFKKRIIYAGMPDMGLICLAKLIVARVNIVGVIPPHRSADSYSIFMQFAKNNGLNVIPYENSLSEEDFLQKISDLKPDLGIVCSYDRLFPEALINIPKDGIINCHPSLLPNYRGANSYAHVIINNEKQTGITLHFMDKNFDTGDIVAQIPVNISPNETMGTLFNSLNCKSAQVILNFLKKYETMDVIPRVKQPEGKFKEAPAIDMQHGNNFINWNSSAKDIERFIRALNPFVHALTKINGQFMNISSAQVTPKKSDGLPGTISSVKGGLFVNTEDFILKIKVLQFSSFLICDGEEFIKRFNIKKGEKFE